ncbi:uncharacterized protein LOC120148106 isoform X1 [Hibiscus syriacus]|uniref:uncharacterized protein LOC120148106 isoform X1 n=1 Tax=Hibiscus syriacus TaxID=106335 RepID=UPI0019218BFF|nr:uncharacterized protein LOC120148106 isoform X1 [Hibiscus syriacus]
MKQVVLVGILWVIQLNQLQEHCAFVAMYIAGYKFFMKTGVHCKIDQSLSFSYGVAEPGIGSRGKDKVAEVFHHRSIESQSSISTSQQPTSRGNSILPKEDLYDIDKAWKMTCMTTSSSNQNSTKLPCLGSTSKEAISSAGLHTSKMHQNEERTGKQKQYEYHYHEREREKHKSPDRCGKAKEDSYEYWTE